jgi:murein DD-endopeptidase MepM/ murein hydrolase activator NlpD
MCHPRFGLLGALAVAALVAVSAPSYAAAAGTGGTSVPSGGGAGGTTFDPDAPQVSNDSGGKRSRGARPVLASFSVGTGRFFDLGSPARVDFRIDARAKTVHVKLEVRSAGRRIRLIDLGDRATRSAQTYRLTGREQGRFPEGALQLRLTARDARGRGLKPRGRISATGDLGFYWHRFPLVGHFTYGGPDARFGAGRDGHVHQGQDLIAPAGTPIVAPRGGVVTAVDYQPGGAGYYVVLAVTDENRSYAFMHLLEGSTRVREGQAIGTGERIGDVGSTGASSGAHLHFELWDGAWQAGGHAVDPLPSLERWDAVS